MRYVRFGSPADRNAPQYAISRCRCAPEFHVDNAVSDPWRGLRFRAEHRLAQREPVDPAPATVAGLQRAAWGTTWLKVTGNRYRRRYYPPRHLTDAGDFRVLVFTPDDLPTWKVHGEN